MRLEAEEAEAISSTESSRMTELGQLEAEFGIQETDDDDTESSARTKEKFDSIEKEQLEVSARLEELQRLEDISRVEEVQLQQNEEASARLEELQRLEDISRVEEEQSQQNEEVVISPEQNNLDTEAEKQADMLTKSDLSYQPSDKVMENTSLLMNDIAGLSLTSYDVKDGYFTGRDVGVDAGNTLSVPIRVSTPGTIVEFTVEKKSYDFGFGITAFLDNGQVAKVKVRNVMIKTSIFDLLLLNWNKSNTISLLIAHCSLLTAHCSLLTVNNFLLHSL